MKEIKCSLKSHQVVGARVYRKNKLFVPTETFVRTQQERLDAALEKEYEQRQNRGCCCGCRISN